MRMKSIASRLYEMCPRRSDRPWSLVVATGVFAIGQAVVAPPAAAGQTVASAHVWGTTTIHGGPLAPNVVSTPEIRDDAGDGSVKAQTSGGSSSALSLPTPSANSRLSNRAIPSKEAPRFGVILQSLSRAEGFTDSSALPPPPTVNPNPPGQRVRDVSTFTFGFNGITHHDQRLAGTGPYLNTQYSLEPPDQGLCAGNGFVVEAVNNAVEVYDSSGHSLTGPEALSQFFGFAPEVDRKTGITGPFISDPKCAYDKHSGHWYLTELAQDNGTNAGATGRNYNLLAISKTADPTGDWVLIATDVTDDGLNGTPSHPGCPCFGDQPLLGFDKFGVYQSTNEFGATVFNGAQIYALSKADLIAAANGSLAPITVVAIDAGALAAPSGGTWYTIQPAISTSRDIGEGEGGKEYFLSALQFGVAPYQVLDNRLAVWALTNTASLSTPTPALNLSYEVIASETYGQPNPAQQKPGPTPLATSLGDGLEYINTNDDRMNQVVYADGVLYGSLNTIIGDGTRTGIAWFAVTPRLSHGVVSARVARQGYVAVDGNNVIFPSVAATEDGSGIMTFTLVGPDYFPSAAYTRLDGSPWSSVRIVANGTAPDDGFTGYSQYGGTGVGRWGDYSAAAVSGDRIWFATEYIPNLPRTLLANWGTWIGTVEAE